jgi:Domain of unknown function (DUF5063)
MKPEWRSSVDEFRRVAEQFIQAVDSRDKLSGEQFLKRIEICLTELHASALRLPVVVPERDDIDAQPFSAEAWATLQRELREKIGTTDHYWSVFDATAQDSPVDGSVAGDISEIYMDLKESLRETDQHALDADILWELRFSFTSHWGRHLTSALKAIFDLRSNGTLG